MAGTGILVDNEKYIPDVHYDVAALVYIIDIIAHGSFPVPVKIYPDQVAVSI
jgi:hypothetical protein